MFDRHSKRSSSSSHSDWGTAQYAPDFDSKGFVDIFWQIVDKHKTNTQANSRVCRGHLHFFDRIKIAKMTAFPSRLVALQLCLAQFMAVQ